MWTSVILSQQVSVIVCLRAETLTVTVISYFSVSLKGKTKILGRYPSTAKNHQKRKYILYHITLNHTITFYVQNEHIVVKELKIIVNNKLFKLII